MRIIAGHGLQRPAPRPRRWTAEVAVEPRLGRGEVPVEHRVDDAEVLLDRLVDALLGQEVLHAHDPDALVDHPEHLDEGRVAGRLGQADVERLVEQDEVRVGLDVGVVAQGRQSSRSSTSRWRSCTVPTERTGRARGARGRSAPRRGRG